MPVPDFVRPPVPLTMPERLPAAPVPVRVRRKPPLVTAPEIVRSEPVAAPLVKAWGAPKESAELTVFWPLVELLLTPLAPRVSVKAPESVTALVDVNSTPTTLRLAVSAGCTETVPKEAICVPTVELAGATEPTQLVPSSKSVVPLFQTMDWARSAGACRHSVARRPAASGRRRNGGVGRGGGNGRWERENRSREVWGVLPRVKGETYGE